MSTELNLTFEDLGAGSARLHHLMYAKAPSGRASGARCPDWYMRLPVLQADQFAHRMIRAKYRKHWQVRVQAALTEALGDQRLQEADLWQELSVQYTRYSSKRPDYQSLVYSYKPLQDAGIGWLYPDDSDVVIPLQTYRWEYTDGLGRVNMRLMRIR